MEQKAHHSGNPDDHGGTAPWRDKRLTADARVADLIARMTLDEKLAQLVGVWVGATHDGRGVAPHQDDLAGESPSWEELIRDGLGQLTRVFGTRPVTPAAGAKALAASQREVMAANRFGIPAVAHEECLAGFTTWGATVFPVPLAWGASFDTALVRRMAQAIGQSMRSVGVQQGLAPVLDVVRDARWGRVEETIGEDPYLVGEIGSAYVSGLESAGIIATLKHFAGYAASRAGRNLAPVSMGTRELADVVLPPFETALREAGARSVMAAYTDTDGVPASADEALLTGVLRDEWGFEGTVVADYFGISFLELLHRTAGSPGEAAAQALTAGVDVELPTARCYGRPLAGQVREHTVDEALVDRALTRVLRQKCELGLLDPDWSPEPPVREPDLDPPGHRALARQLARESVVLLADDGGLLPLGEPGRVAVVGPLADDALGLQGCYSFPAHVGVRHPEWDMGVAVPSVLQGLRESLGADRITYEQGCPVQETDRSGFTRAVTAAQEADVCLAVLGDRAGLFGSGTSGEGCDVPDLSLPGVQSELLEELLESGTPVVLIVVSGRPYALGPAAGRAAAIVQTFFPGEEGAPALADVLTGRADPSGRLPVSVPRLPGGQPATYLSAPLGRAGEVSSQDPTPLYPFGHGLSYARFRYGELTLSSDEVPVDGTVEISCTVTNTGERAGTDVVQLYLTDPVAQVTRPWRQLAGFARLELAPGESRRVTFALHTDRTAFTGRDGRRVVEPGLIEVRIGRSSTDTPLEGSFRIAGTAPRPAGHDRVLRTPVRVTEYR
ncbi:beta-glucosidase [Streptomyces abyssalis]|uniref:Exo-alpha-(1->6)-L-arabinopyranosidase n=1 Tax=Streptomyces abyssalis TaxID=933944 RepID=A0A1E7JNU9_9ACTN|nr:glycoside hydrolase family 3 N-terminal domain-containing protein [Streptomyces abyssalis]OEU86690.1 beta-glucosidase [Streptomyces abyssalis]OEU89923.1 beta-glucosidase [Streptomyces abyssalis]